ncbi:RNA polymerase sigma factor SigF [Nocardia abscessus]|uniref:RNA polymerase sigma factor SigF n=1 Tax=Nocardia abscessus TaxID=120957 RepID=UPI0024586822|nr:RNA polymerase sigma factor SigF [Nocardia abscessus]
MNEPSRTKASHPRRDRDSYDDIEPRFDQLAALEASDPHHGQVREEIIRLCLPLAEHIARRFAGRGEPFEDLYQVACMGLVYAVDRYDVSRAASFLGFAIPTIMGEVRRHFRDHAWSVRVPRGAKDLQGHLGPAVEELAQRLGRMPRAREIAAELEVGVTEVTQALIASNAYNTASLDAVFPDDQYAAAALSARLGAEEPCYRLTEEAMAVRPLIAALPAQEREVLMLRFFESLTQTQIADRIGVSQMHVSRMLSRILAKLREQALAEQPRRAAA